MLLSVTAGGKTTTPDMDVSTEIVHIWKADFSSYCLVPNHTGSKYDIPVHFHGSTPPVNAAALLKPQRFEIHVHLTLLNFA